jgi:hypothetical protein
MDDIFARVWENLGGRIGGPLAFRLLIQPLVVSVLAIRAGIQDAHAARPAYLWAVLTRPQQRLELLRDAWKSVAKVFTLAFCIDVVYQLIVERWIYPGEALLVAFLLAIVPYVLVRGPVARAARAMRHLSASGTAEPTAGKD